MFLLSTKHKVMLTLYYVLILLSPVQGPLGAPIAPRCLCYHYCSTEQAGREEITSAVAPVLSPSYRLGLPYVLLLVARPRVLGVQPAPGQYTIQVLNPTPVSNEEPATDLE